MIDVDASTTLVVRTDNSVYRITIVGPYAREVLVQGGKFFPERTRACLSGSTFGGSCLKLGWVGLGLHLEFHAGALGHWSLDSWFGTRRVTRGVHPHPDHPEAQAGKPSLAASLELHVEHIGVRTREVFYPAVAQPA